MTPRIGSLFSGYEGLGMGVQAVLGGELAFVSDIDPGACKILAHHYPDVPNLGDITTVDWSQVEPVDILTGGSPCQDLSHAGKRQGMTAGTRSNLWVAMREAIAQLRPRLVIWENVRGAASADATSDLEFCAGCMGDPWDRGPVLRALGRVVGDLADLGYVGGFHGLRAADVGAPHGRFRYFLAAEHPSVAGPQGAAERWIQPGLPSEGHRGSGEVALLPTPAVNDMGAGKTVDAWDAWTADMQAKHGNGNGHGKSLAIEAQRLLPTPKATNNENRQSLDQYGMNLGQALGVTPLEPTEERLLGTPTVAMSQRSEEFASKGQAPAEFAATYDGTWGDYAPAIARWEAILGRPAPAPTMTSAKGNPQLAPAFVEWMMGLPEGWVTDVPGLSRNEMLKALGNGVVPQQAEAALRWLLPQIARVAA